MTGGGRKSVAEKKARTRKNYTTARAALTVPADRTRNPIAAEKLLCPRLFFTANVGDGDGDVGVSFAWDSERHQIGVRTNDNGSHCCLFFPKFTTGQK